MNSPTAPRQLHKFLVTQLPQMIEVLRRFTLAESPSIEKDAADRCAEIIAAEWRKRPVQAELVPQKSRGNHIRIVWRPETAAPKSQLLVLGHYDTVYATGTLEKMPFQETNGKIFGPGVFDMKAGIVQALFALDALLQTKTRISKQIVFLWTSDEEIGSESSRELLESEAKRSDAVFVLEPSLGPKGFLKTTRKGVGEAELIVTGKASHAGLAPEKGVNAVHELALQIAKILEWNDLKRGVTVNAGVIKGGTRVNVIAEQAKAVLDLRALKIADMRKIEKKLKSLKPILRGAKLQVTGGFSRVPLERKISAALFTRAQSLASEMGIKLGEATAGGGSDGNLTAALGIPTLDGLGAVGDGAHSAHEHIFANKMPERATLLAALLSTS
ncbi:MAG: M20 family metallopeptidase [Acidobacteria bacterium]|nr:M20 family metallopeptidase [Acidobacteriota bacterium]MBS1865126.1 M20 family metallopeptidase [Acidobacteriota bacterium]